jgi:hypothetical protein
VEPGARGPIRVVSLVLWIEAAPREEPGAFALVGGTGPRAPARPRGR